MWSGHSSGHVVYPKKSSVTEPCVFFQKSNARPSVSVSVNFGFGSGGFTRPPRYDAASACARGRVGHGRPDTAASRPPTSRRGTRRATRRGAAASSPHHDRPDHPLIVMQRADVAEDAGRGERHAEARHTKRRLRGADPFARGRTEKTRVDRVARRSDRRMQRPVEIRGDVGGRRRKTGLLAPLRTSPCDSHPARCSSTRRCRPHGLRSGPAGNASPPNRARRHRSWRQRQRCRRPLPCPTCAGRSRALDLRDPPRPTAARVARGWPRGRRYS